MNERDIPLGLAVLLMLGVLPLAGCAPSEAEVARQACSVWNEQMLDAVPRVGGLSSVSVDEFVQRKGDYDARVATQPADCEITWKVEAAASNLCISWSAALGSATRDMQRAVPEDQLAAATEAFNAARAPVEAMRPAGCRRTGDRRATSPMRLRPVSQRHRPTTVEPVAYRTLTTMTRTLRLTPAATGLGAAALACGVGVG